MSKYDLHEWGWHPWFAWHPAFVPSCGWVWLRWVERQFSSKWWSADECGELYPIQTWTKEYRLIVRSDAR